MNSEKLREFIIYEEAGVVEALQKIDLNTKGILYVVDKKDHLSGSITDGDIRRWLIKTADLSGQVSQIMNKTPKSIYQKDSTNIQESLKKNGINSIPVITTTGKIRDIVFKAVEAEVAIPEERNELSEVPVIIMAGGKGTRLYPYTKVLPKPLIPIGDVPIMERIINRFQDYGVKKFYATLNYRKNMIKSYFSEFEEEFLINYIEENQPLGTAGSLHLIEDKFDAPVIVTNCDILIHADYYDIYKYHLNSENDMTIVSALKNILVPYGVIHSKENGGVMSMEEKPKLSYFINTGMYILNPELLEKIPKDTFFHMTDLADLLLKEGGKVGMYPISEDSFLDMGEFEEMHRMEKKLNLKFD